MIDLNCLRTLNNNYKFFLNKPGNLKKIHKNKRKIKRMKKVQEQYPRLKSWLLLSCYSNCNIKFKLTENRNGIVMVSIFSTLYELSEYFQKRLEKLFIPFE